MHGHASPEFFSAGFSALAVLCLRMNFSLVFTSLLTRKLGVGRYTVCPDLGCSSFELTSLLTCSPTDPHESLLCRAARNPAGRAVPSGGRRGGGMAEFEGDGIVADARRGYAWLSLSLSLSHRSARVLLRRGSRPDRLLCNTCRPPSPRFFFFISGVSVTFPPARSPQPAHLQSSRTLSLCRPG